MKLITLFYLLIFSNVTLADEVNEKILKFISNSKYYKHAVKVVSEKPFSWNEVSFSNDIKAKKVGHTFSKDPVGNKGQNSSYLVTQPYTETYGLDGYNASLLILVRTSTFEPLGEIPIFEAIEVLSIIDTNEGKLIPRPDLEVDLRQ